MFSADRMSPRINWKVAIDTFLEGYHIPYLHQKTISPYFIGNCGTFDSAGAHGRMCLGRPSLKDLRNDAKCRFFRFRVNEETNGKQVALAGWRVVTRTQPFHGVTETN
jgi:phenylpropionate dioxygenase-like ring-hydroxylating dioxygenase large terminal subunit